MAEKSLSPSHFADAIGVQRSSISHILAGRNKPSFEIIQKIIKKFPDVGFDWLMNDEIAPSFVPEIPSAKRGAKSTSTKSMNGSHSTPPKPFEVPLSESSKKNFSDTNFVQPNLVSTEIIANPEKKVERILIFYSDKTFSEYKPT
ncbi:MAG: helix-turn-helix transcriptional regulator [Spirosomataceae bacterium]